MAEPLDEVKCWLAGTETKAAGSSPTSVPPHGPGGLLSKAGLRKKGDVPGHQFHGSQHSVGDARPAHGQPVMYQGEPHRLLGGGTDTHTWVQHVDGGPLSLVRNRDLKPVREATTKGDIAGHAFHGNQYSGDGGGRDARDVAAHQSVADKLGPEGARFVRSQIRDARSAYDKAVHAKKGEAEAAFKNLHDQLSPVLTHGKDAMSGDTRNSVRRAMASADKASYAARTDSFFAAEDRADAISDAMRAFDDMMMDGLEDE